MNEHLRLQSEPVAAPEELGLAAAGLERLSSVMQREVETSHVPGISMLIARRGKIGYRRDFGALRPGGPPMPGNAIFRIYSMTKPIVTVALMMLLEEGKLFVADPIAQIHPRIRQREGRRRERRQARTGRRPSARSLFTICCVIPPG